MQELVGAKIGPYQIQKHLARGGMANIYLARNVENETEPLVAIKLVHSSIGEFCERFRFEAKEHYTLRHDHILPVLAYGESNSWCYLVTPYMEGGTLTPLLDRGPLSVQEATEVFSQLANALHYAHEQGIVHRDIKPSNVLMRDEHYAYLADFGLVKHVGLDTSLTGSGYIMGTPQYMAPELAEEEASPLSDIYALGILLYQMLTGQIPFKGTSPFTVYLKQAYEQPVTPSVLNPAIPPEVAQVVLRALAKKPNERYQTARDFNIAYQLAVAQADVRQSERVEVSTPDAALPLLQVRWVQRGDQYQSNEPQQREAILLARRKRERGLVVLVPILAFLMLLLLSGSAKNTQQISQAQLAGRSLIQVTHDQGNAKSLSPTSTTASPSQVVVMAQQHGEGSSDNSHRNGNGSSNNSYGKSHYKKEGHKHE